MSLELEEEWSKQKAAKQEAGRNIKPPRKSRKGWIITVIGLAVTAALVIAVVLAGDESELKVSGSAELVRLELRAMPEAEIRVDGKKVGTTPMSLQFQKSTREITVEATMMRHMVRRGGAQKNEKFVQERRVILNRDHLLDFSIKNARLVETVESGKDD